MPTLTKVTKPTFTEEDVRDAYYAQQTRRLAQTEQTTPEALIQELANTPREAEGYLAQFRRGERWLADYIVLTSDRSVVGGRFDEAATERIVSPIVIIEAGHIATATAYCAVALAWQ